MRVGVVLLAIGIAVFPSSGRASDAPVSVQEGPAAEQTVELPFAPPLGRTLRYRLVRERTRAGRPDRQEVYFHIAFRRLGADYVMSAQLQLPAGVPRPSASSPFAHVFDRPTEFRVSEDGELLEVLDLEQHWEAAEAGLAELRRAYRMDARAREAADAMVRQLREMPPEAQLEMFSRNIAPIVAAAGGTFPIAGELSEERAVPSIVGGSIEQSSTTRVTQVDEATVRLIGRSSVSNAELEAQTRAMFGRFAPLGLDSAAFRLISNDRVETYEVSRATGLTQRFRAETVLVVVERGTRTRSVDILALELVP